LADARVGVNAISAMVGYSVRTVRRWIRRAKHSGKFHDHARSGCPAIYPLELQGMGGM